ncbi:MULTISPECIES: YolD-like family protein [Paenibacillus]|uniref:YolD-like protein n=1 Tax=Paenibacillus naphthalenovorans TaxID=162209 RepID=A0A0U2VDH5_9BACL|nr:MULTISPECIES: YolD-like family protein [Paenibacillus]ALS21571.1 YolD-like protein [Paenibacillus naphthalenovorans]NTZ18268.1 YolD-like family protein [Paenibacillus sp. JMULE4]GCL71297.1 YolD-like family protein [Paenibacillus naphthalenovorans]SDI74401.1 YolD-like protein [Paenibacillus naphthalenovorans]
MKDNKLTPGKNILWESSRMMLPEHKEQLLRHRRELGRQEKPTLDEQRLEELGQTLGIALHEDAALRLTLYDNGERKSIDCTILQADLHLQRIKVRCSEGSTWVRLADLIGAELL